MGDCVHCPITKHGFDSKSLEMFDHFRDMKKRAIVCHCDTCEFALRLLRAVDNKDPILSVKGVIMAKW